MFARLSDLLARLRDPAIRAGWTFLYVFVGAFTVALSPLGDTIDLSVGKAALIAGVLAAIKTVVAMQFGDPLAAKTNLSDFAVRLLHTAWQSLAAVFIATGFTFDRATIWAAVVAVIINAIKSTVLPPLPATPPSPEIPGNQDGGVVDVPVIDAPADPATDVTVDPALDPSSLDVAPADTGSQDG
jgi:hypothetical protein